MKDKMWFCASDLMALFRPENEFVYWSDSDNTWYLDEYKWGTYCAELANRGVNMMRWLGWSVWFNYIVKDYKHNLTPFIEESSGLYHLLKPNQTYWNIIDRAIEIANYPSTVTGIKAPGITIWIDLVYQYTNNEDDKKKSPWRNNVQGFKSLYDPKVWPHVKEYMITWLNLSKIKGRKIKYGLGNEIGADGLPLMKFELDVFNEQKIWPFSWGICWDMPPIKAMEISKEQPGYIIDKNLFMWYPLRQTSKKWDCSILRECHVVGQHTKDGKAIDRIAVDNWGINPIRWCLSDDGTNPKPDAKYWKELMEFLCTYKGGTKFFTATHKSLENPTVAIEHLPDDKPWHDFKDEQLNIFDTIAQIYEKYIGKLENRGKWAPSFVAPECKIGDVKKEKCWDGSEITTHICENGKWVATGATCPIKPEKINWLKKYWRIILIAILLLFVLGKIIF